MKSDSKSNFSGNWQDLYSRSALVKFSSSLCEDAKNLYIYLSLKVYDVCCLQNTVRVQIKAQTKLNCRIKGFLDLLCFALAVIIHEHTKPNCVSACRSHQVLLAPLGALSRRSSRDNRPSNPSHPSHPSHPIHPLIGLSVLNRPLKTQVDQIDQGRPK